MKMQKVAAAVPSGGARKSMRKSKKHRGYSILTYDVRSVVARDLRARGSVMFAITSEVAITSRARRPEIDGYLKQLRAYERGYG